MGLGYIEFQELSIGHTVPHLHKQKAACCLALIFLVFTGGVQYYTDYGYDVFKSIGMVWLILACILMFVGLVSWARFGGPAEYFTQLRAGAMMGGGGYPRVRARAGGMAGYGYRPNYNYGGGYGGYARQRAYYY